MTDEPFTPAVLMEQDLGKPINKPVLTMVKSMPWGRPALAPYINEPEQTSPILPETGAVLVETHLNQVGSELRTVQRLEPARTKSSFRERHVSLSHVDIPGPLSKRTDADLGTGANSVPAREEIRIEPILPAIPGEPVARHSYKEGSVGNHENSEVLVPMPRALSRNLPVLPSVPDQISPIGVEMPDDTAPYFTEKENMIFAQINDIHKQPGRPAKPKRRPKIISSLIPELMPIGTLPNNPQVLNPNTELAALDVKFLPAFPLPGSPKGALFLLAIDTSGSVKGAPLKGIKKSANDFVKLMGPKDRAGIITFDDRVKNIGDFIADKETLHKEIEALQPAGSMTMLFDALMVAYDMIQKQDSKNRYIVLFSDGKDEGSQVSLEKALSSLHSANISILAVGYTRVEKKYLKILSAMARETEGIFLQTPQFQDMISLYRLSRPADTKPPTLEFAKQVSLKINSRPSSAQVFVNGKYTGKTPLVLPLPPAKYEVRILKPAYYDWQAQIALKKVGQTIDVRLLPIEVRKDD